MMNHEQLLKLIRDKVGHPATPKELEQRLKITADERPAFKRLLSDLVARGALLETRGNRLGVADMMDVVVGRIVTHPRGFGFVAPDRPIEGLAGDLYISGNNLNQAMHGDRVVARIERIGDDGRAEGRILRILTRGAQTIVGRFEADAYGSGFVVPFDRRLVMDVEIPSADQRGAKAGDMVVVEITRWPTPARAGTKVPAERIALREMCAAIVIRDAIARLWHNLVFVIGGVLFVFCSHTMFPFQIQQQLSEVGWIYVAVTFGAILVVLTQMKRNDILQRLTSPDPTERAGWDSSFVWRVAVFALLPLLTLFTAQFPDIGQVLVRWIDPVRQVLP